jgi:hypothetical protein
MKKTFGTTYRFFGILVGGMSLFILSQTAFEFGFSEALGMVVGYYQALIYPIVGLLLEPPLRWLLSLTHWPLPESWKDWAVIYIVFAASYYRMTRQFATSLNWIFRIGPKAKITNVFYLEAIAFPIAFPVLILASMWLNSNSQTAYEVEPLFPASQHINTWPRVWMKNFAIEIGLVVTAFILLLILNAGVG